MYSPVQKHKKWEWSTRIREDREDEEDKADKKDEKVIKLSIDKSGDKLYLVKKVIKWLKLSSDKSYQVIQVIKW